MLALSRRVHPDTVVIDATLGDRGQTVFNVYVYPGETLLEARAHETIKLASTREHILASSSQSSVCIVTDKEMPDWMREGATKTYPPHEA